VLRMVIAVSGPSVTITGTETARNARSRLSMPKR
jgi:hypothetical protein